MMTQTSTQGECCPAHPAAPRQSARAEEHAGELRKLIDSGTLSLDGLAAAHGALSLTYAVLALRETITDAAADTADAVTDVDATLGIIAGAVTDTAAGGGDLAAVPRMAGAEGGR
jgi:hypothetical protein